MACAQYRSHSVPPWGQACWLAHPVLSWSPREPPNFHWESGPQGALTPSVLLTASSRARTRGASCGHSICSSPCLRCSSWDPIRDPRVFTVLGTETGVVSGGAEGLGPESLGREGAVWAGRLGLPENSENRVSEGEGGRYAFWLNPFSELLGWQGAVFWERILWWRGWQPGFFLSPLAPAAFPTASAAHLAC